MLIIANTLNRLHNPLRSRDHHAEDASEGAGRLRNGLLQRLFRDRTSPGGALLYVYVWPGRTTCKQGVDNVSRHQH
jgi:hypothetical protein